MSENSERQLRTVHLPSILQDLNDAATIICIVRKLSEDYAVIEVENPNGIPQEFELFVGPERVRHYCAIVWRKKTRIRVAFV
jgi:hypothetical protein